jgi:hypothetical protein
LINEALERFKVISQKFVPKLTVVAALCGLSIGGVYADSSNAATPPTGAVSPLSNAASAGLSLSSTAGAAGSSLTVTVNNCPGATVTFTQGSLVQVFPGNEAGEVQDPTSVDGTFTATAIIPVSALAGAASISAQCKVSVPGATYSEPFTVTSSGSQSVTPNAAANPPYVGIAAPTSGAGYWLVGADGGVFTFGNITFYGSLPGEKLKPSAPIVGIVATPDGAGYWLVGSDGGVYSFGDAAFYGSEGGQKLNKPIVALRNRECGQRGMGIRV